MKKYVKTMIFVIMMPDEDNKILKYTPGEKSLKVLFIIYADLECLLKKINTCQNNPDKSSTETKATHRPSDYSLLTCCSFDKSKNEQKYYRGKDCMKIFCKDLKDQAMKVINCEKKEMVPFTNKLYVKKNLIMIIRSEIIVIMQEVTEELHIISVI